MFKNLFIAAAIALASPSFVAAQDIFFSFDSESLDTNSLGFNHFFDSGSVYIFSDGQFNFDALDLNFSTSGGAIRITGGEAFNPTFNTIGGRRFDSSELTLNNEGNAGRLLMINISENGVNVDTGPLYDSGFVAGVGENGAVLLARLDIEVIDRCDTANLELSLGPLGAVALPDTTIALDPSFGNLFFHRIQLTCPGDYLAGDLNADLRVDFLDIAPFIAVLASREYELLADMDFNGEVNFLDIHLFIQALAP